ncbi:sugar phosphate isomerase/epimerase [Quadrisphaera sp. INWT6]|uniref:sugar phosphate isomerase/epimerase family protein n=1 Tax=Quadrisphaera sp. INWT6 TaxID=2596917 RepID=UPI0018921F23|nr:TIM barrel protein [Quadrisphaera sp. INWT6]MBF5081851.1 sugar phosphate isomerase/epimerase [Quadrisphaera sp. INWT6]
MAGPQLEVVGSALALAPQQPGADRAVREGGPALWRRQLSRLRRAGFSALDVPDGWLPVVEMSPAERQDLGSVLDELGLAVRGLNVTRCSVVDPERGEENTERLLRAAEVVAELGWGLLGVGFHPRLRPDQGWPLVFWESPSTADDLGEETRALAADRLRRVAARAAELGVQVSVEMYEDTLAATGADAVRLVQDVGAPNLGINPDLGNLHRTARPEREHWLETVRAVAPHMDYWHLKDCVRAHVDGGPPAVVPTPLGQGQLDYRLAVTEAVAGGYRGPLVVEHYGGDAVWVQELGRRYLERLLDDLAEEGVL